MQIPGYCRKHHKAVAPRDEICDEAQLRPEFAVIPRAEHAVPEAPSLVVMASLPDSALMDRTAHGDHAAFDEIDHRYHPLLVNYLRRRLHDDAAAEDIAQEVMVRLYNSSTHFDVTRSLRPWLFSIASNEIHRYWRDTANIRNTMPLISPSKKEGETVDLTEMLRDQGLTPDEQLNLDSLVWAVRSQLGRLPHDQRTALLMRMHGMKIKDIAATLDIPQGTVASRLRYGTLRLKKGLSAVPLSQDAAVALKRIK